MIWLVKKSVASKKFFPKIVNSDNKLKDNKYVPGVKIPIILKNKIKQKPSCILVLAWNFFDDIKKNNISIADKFINIKDLEN